MCRAAVDSSGVPEETQLCLLTVVKCSLQWPETHGHTEVRDYIPGGDAYADECQLDRLTGENSGF